MTRTYTVRHLAALLLFPLLGAAQTLEDKVSQSRKLQAQSLLGMDEQTLDSALKEKRELSRRKGLPTTRMDELSEPSMLDALISSPESTSYQDTVRLDSLGRPIVLDSAARAKARLAKAPPKRYEQRIFRSVDRSAFSSARGAVGRDYVLGPGDAVKVSLWGDKENQYDLILDNEGKVFVEGVGLVALGGSNLSEAQTVLKGRLSKIYSGIARGTSHVDVSLSRAGPIRVFVLGEVKLPGGYVFTGNTSVLSAMYFAQGPSDIGTVRNLQLTRSGKKYPLDLYQYLIYGQSLSPDVLRDGDILFAARADILVEIEGDVGRPATYELKQGEGVKELLEFAGRLNPTAASHRIVLQRIFPGGKVDYVDLPPPGDFLSGKAKVDLQAGDKVFVEKSTEPT